MPKCLSVSDEGFLVTYGNPTLSIRIVFANGAVLGPTEIAVLEAIEANGSIQATARSGEFSYRYAWRLVQYINDIFESPAVVTEAGGYNGGGSKLSSSHSAPG